jgi:hypothetical protein
MSPRRLTRFLDIFGRLNSVWTLYVISPAGVTMMAVATYAMLQNFRKLPLAWQVTFSIGFYLSVLTLIGLIVHFIDWWRIGRHVEKRDMQSVSDKASKWDSEITRQIHHLDESLFLIEKYVDCKFLMDDKDPRIEYVLTYFSGSLLGLQVQGPPEGHVSYRNLFINPTNISSTPELTENQWLNRGESTRIYLLQRLLPNVRDELVGKKVSFDFSNVIVRLRSVLPDNSDGPDLILPIPKRWRDIFLDPDEEGSNK